MRIYEDSMDQVLLCMGYDFADDCPMQREIARRQFGLGASVKEWWRYRNVHLGLRTFVAYEGRQPVGHIEIVPIQHALRPIKGGNQITILCVYVEEHARGQGVGRALVRLAEHVGRQSASALAVVARREGEFMPADFFLHMGYEIVDDRAHELLLSKPVDPGYTPRFIPLKFEPSLAQNKLHIDFVHCEQCPLSFRAKNLLEAYVSTTTAPVELQVVETNKREDVERFGISQGVFIQGSLITDDHPMNTDWLHVIHKAIEEMQHLEA
jgi:GNAT superfamily N-acetyltransferase